MLWGTQVKLPTVAPLSFNFMPSWWYREYGIAYKERVFLDPEYRAQILREMSRLIYERFGDIGMGERDPSPVYCNDNLVDATMPAALGCEVFFMDDQYPTSVPLKEEEIRRLVAPQNIADIFPFREIIRQAKEMNARHGLDLRPGWGLPGVQNVAVQVRGTDFFLDYYAEPSLATRLLDLGFHLMVSSLDYFFSVGATPNALCNQNCTVPLVGPNTYQEYLFPYEQKLYAVAQKRQIGYAIHHCGHFDEYAPFYRRVGNFSSLSIGWGSDIRLALDTFPEAKIGYIVGHQFIKDGPVKVIRDTFRALVDKAGADIRRVSFDISDLDYGTPDEHIRAVVDALLVKN